jgi:phosphate-selective porin OprO/OprP
MATAAAVAFAWLASPARADEGGDPMRDMMKGEIAAFMKAEKEKREKEEKEKGAMKVFWKDGIYFESADKKFNAKIIGRVQVDYWTFDADEDFEAAIGDEFNTGLFFRRARMGAELTFLKNTKVKIEYDFARGGANQSGFTDTYVALTGLKDCGWPVPDVYVGHFLEPFSLEELTSDNYITFMEFAQPVSTFVPFRNTGIMLQKGFVSTKPQSGDAFDRVLAQLGAFHAFSNSWGDGIFSDGGPSEFDGDQDGWAVTGRVAALPWVDCRCPCRLVHLGVAGSYRADLRPDNVRFRSRPEVGFGPRSVDTGADIAAEDMVMLGAELAVVYDRFSAQGEYILVDVNAPTQGDPVYTGWYAQVSYLLTDECKTYEKGKGVFGRVKPCKPLYCEDCHANGPGAWEVAVRVSTLDLNDGDPVVQGGEQFDVTFGVNWYLNNSVRVMFNYVHAEIDDHPLAVDGTVDAFGIRVQAFW